MIVADIQRTARPRPQTAPFRLRTAPKFRVRDRYDRHRFPADNQRKLTREYSVRGRGSFLIYPCPARIRYPGIP
jgi:hypothetical protein